MNIPQITHEELKIATPETMADWQVQLQTTFDAHQAIVLTLVEKIVYEQLKTAKNLDIGTIQILPTYEYNDEGYSFAWVMVNLDNEDCCYDEEDEDEEEDEGEGNTCSKAQLQEKIDYALSELAPMLKDDIDINVKELKEKFIIVPPKKKPKIFGKINKPAYDM